MQNQCQRYTDADLKLSLHVCVHIKTIPWKSRFLDPKNYRVICLWSLQISQKVG